MRRLSKNFQIDDREFLKIIKSMKNNNIQKKFANAVVERISSRFWFEIYHAVPIADKPYKSSIVGGNALYPVGSLRSNLYRYDKMPNEIDFKNTAEVKISFFNSVENGYWGALAYVLEYGNVFSPASRFFSKACKKAESSINVNGIMQSEFLKYFQWRDWQNALKS